MTFQTSTTESRKTAKKESQSSISLDEVKPRVMSQDPSKWSLACIQQCLMKLGQSTSGTKELLVKRIVNLKNNPLILDKIVQKRKNSLQFKSRLVVREIPPPEAPWIADSSQYPKVSLTLFRPANKTFCSFTRIKNQGFLVSKKLSLFLANNLQTMNKKSI